MQTLVFPIPSLHFLMNTLLNFSFEYPGPLRFVIVSHFEYMGGINPVVLAAAHDMISFYVEFENRDLRSVSIMAIGAEALSGSFSTDITISCGVNAVRRGHGGLGVLCSAGGR